MSQDGDVAGAPTAGDYGVTEQIPTDLPSRVFDELCDLIITGRLGIGALLPSERSLTEQFGVNRQVVREAIKRLVQLGMVAPDRGNGTRVLDWRATGSFDLLPLMITRALGDRGPDPLITARNLLDLRLGFTVTVAQLCVSRASDDELAALLEVARSIGGIGNVLDRMIAEWDVWALAARASGNVAMELLLNSMRSAAGPAMLLMFRASSNVLGDPDLLVRSFEAMLARDVAAVDLAVRDLYRLDPSPELLAAELRAAGLGLDGLDAGALRVDDPSVSGATGDGPSVDEEQAASPQ